MELRGAASQPPSIRGRLVKSLLWISITFGLLTSVVVWYVIAHEMGHHVQNLLGILPEVNRLQQQNPADANDLSVKLELQADCLAGVWGYSTGQRGILEPGEGTSLAQRRQVRQLTLGQELLDEPPLGGVETDRRDPCRPRLHQRLLLSAVVQPRPGYGS